MTVRALALALACACPAAPLAAQVPRHLGVDAGLSRVRFRSTAPSGGEVLTGVVAGGQARGTLGVFSLEAAYAQGRLSADTGIATDRDLVDGSVFVSARPIPWLVVRVGPHARAYAASAGGTERWLHWEARVRAEGEIVPGMLQAHVEGALALASDVNVPPGASGARGGEVGLTLRPPQSQVWVRLGYVVDHAIVKNGARSETVEMVVLAVGFGVP